MANFPTQILEIEFNKDGAFVAPPQLDALTKQIRDNNVTDLILISHGWNNDMKEARSLYAALRDRMEAQLANLPALADRKFALAGVLWPSKKFADEELIPGGAASADDDTVDGIILRQLDEIEAAVDPLKDPLAKRDDETRARSEQVKADFRRLRDLVPQLEEFNEANLVEFVRLASKHLAPQATTGEEGDEVIADQLTSGEFDGEPLLKVLGMPQVAPPDPDGRGGAASIDDDEEEDAPLPASRGGAAGIGDFIAGVKAGALNFLNLFTYYTMKARAGTVGTVGVNRVIRTVAALPNAPRIHLVGHSFGCRVMSAAVLGPADMPPVRVGSMTLLQGAFSHYGFATNYMKTGRDGFFRRDLSEGRINGPVIVTHTRRDKAVGVAYAIASRLARQIAQAVGDEHDKYGGIGSNGALDTPEAKREKLHQAGTPYELTPGAVYNLKSDQFIDGHSGIQNDAVGYAILSAVAAS